MARTRENVTVLNNAEMESLLDMRTCLEAMEDAYRDLGLNQAINRPRSHTYFPTQSTRWPNFNYRFKSQEGGIEKFGVWALRIPSDMAGGSSCTTGASANSLV